MLIPRPETEHVVEAALAPAARARAWSTSARARGAIALALKDERPDLEVFATDVSADALDVARANAPRLGLDVTFVLGDLTAGLEVDAVVSNPPYVERHAALMPEVARYEPPLALFGDIDGLAVIRRADRATCARRSSRSSTARARPTRSRRSPAPRGSSASSACATWPGSSACWSRRGVARGAET